jgi:hypothetical protein
MGADNTRLPNPSTFRRLLFAQKQKHKTHLAIAIWITIKILFYAFTNPVQQ